jgi:DnaJ-class molecular chaperone
MSRNSTLYNHSKEEVQECKKVKCPYCKGYGAVSSDDGSCFLCKGYGVIWQSIVDSAWFRALYQRIENSVAY